MLYRDSSPSESCMVWRPSVLNYCLMPKSGQCPVHKNWEALRHTQKKRICRFVWQERAGFNFPTFSAGRLRGFKKSAEMVKRQKQRAVESHSLVCPASKAAQGDFFSSLSFFFFFRNTFIWPLYLFYIFTQSSSKHRGL